MSVNSGLVQKGFSANNRNVFLGDDFLTCLLIMTDGRSRGLMSECFFFLVEREMTFDLLLPLIMMDSFLVDACSPSFLLDFSYSLMCLESLESEEETYIF